MKRKPRILLLIPNLGLGGAQRVFHDHSAALGKCFPVEEALFNLDDGNLYPSGNPLHSLHVGGGGGAVAKLSNFRARISRLRRLKRDRGIDLCISHLEGADYVNLFSKGREKLILCVHGSKLHDPSMIGISKFLRQKILIPQLYNRADRIVTVSRDIAPELISLGVRPEKVRVINNFFEVEEIRAKAREPLSDAEQAVYDSAPVLVTSGRLADQKNQAPLFDIFAALLNDKPSKLVLLGDGELRASLTARAKGLGLRVFEAWNGGALSPNYDVYFLGLQQNPFKYIRPGSLFVFPSAWEGFPLALCEAMICGTPVVTTDCPTGPREILAPSTPIPERPIASAETGTYGMLMPLLNKPATLAASREVWVKTLSSLLEDGLERQRLARLGEQRMQDFTREKIIGQWVELIEEVAR